jgi:hypothetical protein
MPDTVFGPHHPLNELAVDGEKAFQDNERDVRDALASGSLGDACDRLGHRKNTKRARRARELLDQLDDTAQDMIRTRVLAALANGEKFPFVCELPDDDPDLERVKRVAAKEEVRAGKMVVVITTTSRGDDPSR